MIVKKKGLFYYQRENGKSWIEGVRVLVVKGNAILVLEQEDTKRIPDHNIKLYHKKINQEDKKGEAGNIVKLK